MKKNINFLRILTKKLQRNFDIKRVKRTQTVLYTITAFYVQVQYNIQCSSFNLYNHKWGPGHDFQIWDHRHIWSRSISLTCGTTGIRISVKYKALLVPWITATINMFKRTIFKTRKRIQLEQFHELFSS